uniref:Bifunctional metallophosphatase/5'-nucleotidase n=1 Tax=candidate division WOR-3 bacterium TaxID=2052148 RepID=A0A7C4UFZ7_UNCW3
MIILLISIEIEFIYTNDMLGQLEPSYAYFFDLDMPPLISNAGGFIRLVNWEREDGRNPVVLSAGNLLPYPFVYYKEPDIKIFENFLNKAGFDAFLIGTNELSYGIDYLLELINNSNTYFLSCNILSSTLRKPYKIIEREGVKIGIIGATTLLAPIFIPYEQRIEFELENDFEKIEENVKKLKDENVDIIVLLSDGGTYRDSTIAERIKGIDVIISASERGRALPQPLETPINHTIICRCYTNFTSCGILKLSFDEKERIITGYKHRLYTLFYEYFFPVDYMNQ